MTRRSRRERFGERGAISIELAMVAPALLLILGLIYAYGRVQNVNGLLDSGTRAGARAATQERSLESARQAARAAVLETVGQQAPAECTSTLSVEIEQNGYGPGRPVTVVATCQYPLNWALPGAPGSVDGRSEFTSPLDFNREYD